MDDPSVVPTTNIVVQLSFTPPLSSNTFTVSFPEGVTKASRMVSLSPPSSSGYYNISISYPSDIFGLDLQLETNEFGILSPFEMPNLDRTDFIAYLEGGMRTNFTVDINRLSSSESDATLTITITKINPTPLASGNMQGLVYRSLDVNGFETIDVQGNGQMAVLNPTGVLSSTETPVFSTIKDLDFLIFENVPALPSWELSVDDLVYQFPSFPLNENASATYLVRKVAEEGFFFGYSASVSYMLNFLPTIIQDDLLLIFNGNYTITTGETTPQSAESSFTIDPTADGIPIYSFDAQEGKLLSSKAEINVSDEEMVTINGINSTVTVTHEFKDPLSVDLNNPVSLILGQEERDQEDGYTQIPTATFLTMNVQKGEAYYISLDLGVFAASSHFAFLSFVDDQGNYPFYELMPTFAGFSISRFGQVYTAIRDAKIYIGAYGFGSVNITITKVGSADIALPGEEGGSAFFVPLPFWAIVVSLGILPILRKDSKKRRMS